VPAVGFQVDMVLVSAMGERNSGGFTISIDGGIKEADAWLIAAVTETSPDDATCVVTAALTHPVHAVLIRNAATVVFAERQETHRCN